MVSPWTNVSSPPALGHASGTVTLLEAAEFLVTDRSGDAHADAAHGLFFLDTRFLSSWVLTIDGRPPQALDVVSHDAASALHVLRTVPHDGQADAPLAITRRRRLGSGMQERLTVHNHSPAPADVEIALRIEADFADLFEVKDARLRVSGHYWQEVDDGAFVHGVERDLLRRSVRVTFSEQPSAGPQNALWRVSVAPQGTWSVDIDVACVVEDQRTSTHERPPRAPEAVTQTGSDRHIWRAQAPHITTDHPPLLHASRQATDDLAILRMAAPDDPDHSVIAAGAPWFMTLFGRDSLFTSWMAMLVDPDLARGVLHTLARFQGDDVDPLTEEEPGRILHEMRFGDAQLPVLGAGGVYYGTADATPLFVMLVGELARWGLDASDRQVLLSHADRAIEWMREFGDRDGDGYIEYQRATDQGLEHQGWKDSWDGVRFADGRFARTPVALCEVQAYAYGAYVARAHLAEKDGETAIAARYVEQAAELKRRFNEDFWLEDRGWLALGLDADKRPIDALTSNMGHCLWAGILDEDKAARVADHLVSDAMFSGFGVRTLATTMATYNPASYHNGSVWPHDTAICVAGLMRYGFVEHAQRIALGLLDAAEHTHGRLPELFCGFERAEVGAPVPYPTSCSPQAWSAASPLLITRTLLRLDPWVPRGQVWLSPALPDDIRHLRVDGIELGDSRVTIEVVDGEVSVEGLADDLEVVHRARAPLSAYLTTPPASDPATNPA